jgi:AhpD family alkylhydroperoxidase
MDERTKELVAISASVAGHCQPCFKHHFAKARELGIGLEEIREVAGLASRISGVGDKRMAEFVDEIMNEKGN